MENDEIKSFQPSFHSRNSIADNFDKNFQMLKSLGSINLSSRDEPDVKNISTHTYLPSKEYALKIQNAPNSKPSHGLSQKYSIKLENDVMSVRYNTTGSILACGLTNGNLVLIDNDNASILKSFTVSFNKFSVNAIRWKPNNSGNQLVTVGSTDGNLLCYNATSSKFVYKANPAKDAQILSLDYNQDGRFLAIGTSSGNIVLFNDTMQREERTFESGNWFSHGHSNRIFSLKFINDEPNMLLSGGWDKAVFLWDIRDAKAS